jgi:hypothetical protein
LGRAALREGLVSAETLTAKEFCLTGVTRLFQLSAFSKFALAAPVGQQRCQVRTVVSRRE